MTYQDDPNLDRSREIEHQEFNRQNRSDNSVMGWIIGGALALALGVFLAFGMASKNEVANTDTPAVTTTGSGNVGSSNASRTDSPAAPGSTVNNNAREMPSTTGSEASPGRTTTDNPVAPR